MLYNILITFGPSSRAGKEARTGSLREDTVPILLEKLDHGLLLDNTIGAHTLGR